MPKHEATLIRLLLYIVTNLTCLQGHYATFSRIMRFRPPTIRPLCIMGVSRKPLNNTYFAIHRLRTTTVYVTEIMMDIIIIVVTF